MNKKFGYTYQVDNIFRNQALFPNNSHKSTWEYSYAFLKFCLGPSHTKILDSKVKSPMVVFTDYG